MGGKGSSIHTRQQRKRRSDSEYIYTYADINDNERTHGKLSFLKHSHIILFFFIQVCEEPKRFSNQRQWRAVNVLINATRQVASVTVILLVPARRAGVLPRVVAALRAALAAAQSKEMGSPILHQRS